MPQSRRKGKDGENEVGRILYRLWNGEEPPPRREMFVRTKPGVRQREGDLIVPPDFPYFVSIKNRVAPLHQLFSGGQVLRWWAEAVKGAEGAGRRPLLVWKVARGLWWFALYSGGWMHHAPLEELRFIFVVDSRRVVTCGNLGEAQKMTARNAVASTFGLCGEEYGMEVET